MSNLVSSDFADLKTALRDGVARDPLDALVVTVLGGSFLFYVAEKDVNPKVKTYWDALVYVSTCLSVGYADIFAKTPAGQAIATAIMTVGPAMAAKALDPPAGQQTDPVVEKLDAILAELVRARTST